MKTPRRCQKLASIVAKSKIRVQKKKRKVYVYLGLQPAVVAVVVIVVAGQARVLRLALGLIMMVLLRMTMLKILQPPTWAQYHQCWPALRASTLRSPWHLKGVHARTGTGPQYR